MQSVKSELTPERIQGIDLAHSDESKPNALRRVLM